MIVSMDCKTNTYRIGNDRREREEGVPKPSSRCFAHHNHEDVARRIDYLVKPDDVRMSAELQDVDLSLYLVFHVQVMDLVSVQNFHRYLVAG